jgi:hypothetical protein
VDNGRLLAAGALKVKAINGLIQKRGPAEEPFCSELQTLIGEIEVQTTDKKIRLMAREGAVSVALLREAGRNHV